jgi:hypothetical protein
MIQRNRVAAFLLSTFMLALAPACAPLRLPAKGGEPVRSNDGVEVAVSRQSCTQNVDPDFYGSDLVEEVVEMQVRNAAPARLTVQRDAFRLMAPDGVALQTSTWRAADPLPLNAGETRTFQLRFMARGGLDCQQPMTLDLDSGVTMDGRPIRIGAINFQPSRAI